MSSYAVGGRRRKSVASGRSKSSKAVGSRSKSTPAKMTTANARKVVRRVKEVDVIETLNTLIKNDVGKVVYTDTSTRIHILIDPDSSRRNIRTRCGHYLSYPNILSVDSTTSPNLVMKKKGFCEKCVAAFMLEVEKRPKISNDVPVLEVKRWEYLNFNHALTPEYLYGKKTRGGYDADTNSRDLRNSRLYRINDNTLILQAKCGEEYELDIDRLAAVVEKARELSIIEGKLAPSHENDGSDDDY